jgi:hypothetical protein
MKSSIEAANGQHTNNPQFVRSVTRIVGLALAIRLLCGTATAGMIGDYAILRHPANRRRFCLRGLANNAAIAAVPLRRKALLPSPETVLG